ncbi:MAG: NUDIX domain-containing protein [Chloroflexota bacterium]|nr:NUDIX domain-containing protein [Chloroflexota bacterium]
MDEHPRHIVAAMGVVLDSRGMVLLVRTERRDWEPPGGQVEVGEDLLSALRREIYEESGCQAEVNTLVGVYSNVGDPCQVIFAFLCTYLSGEIRPSAETPEVGWYSREEALRTVTHPAQRGRLQDALGFTGTLTYRAYRTGPYELITERGI